MQAELQEWIKEKESLGNWNQTSGELARRWAKIFLRQIGSYGISSLQKIKIEHLQRYRQQRFTTLLSTNSQSMEIKYLLSFFRWCVQKNILLQSPISGWKAPRHARNMPRCLTVKQISTLFQAIDTTTMLGIRNRTILEIMYATGIRRFEIAQLSLHQLDLSSGKLYIQGKGNKTRMVSLLRPSLAWLKKYLKDSRPYLLHNPNNDALFIDKKGDRLSLKSLDYIFKDLKHQTGIKPFSPHVLRHSCSTHLMDAGVPLPYIQELLGHTSLNTTQIYLHLCPPDIKSAYSSAHSRDKWDLFP